VKFSRRPGTWYVSVPVQSGGRSTVVITASGGELAARLSVVLPSNVPISRTRRGLVNFPMAASASASCGLNEVSSDRSNARRMLTSSDAMPGKASTSATRGARPNVRLPTT